MNKYTKRIEEIRSAAYCIGQRANSAVEHDILATIRSLVTITEEMANDIERLNRHRRSHES